MATFVLLHGSFHAAWNWHKVVPILHEAGHEALCIDLPGHGQDRTPPSRVTLRKCSDCVIDALESLDDKPVLLAHSRNGIVISDVAERCPDKVAGLIYLAAYMVPNGASMMDYGIHDTESLVARNIAPGVSRKRIRALTRWFKSGLARKVGAALLPVTSQTHYLKAHAYREALYHDCPDEITELANVLLEPEPNWAGFTPLRLSTERYGRVPKVYIACLQDRAVTLEIQRRMLADTPCDAVFSLDSSHSPFFSQPNELVQKLLCTLDVFGMEISPDVREADAALPA